MYDVVHSLPLLTNQAFSGCVPLRMAPNSSCNVCLFKLCLYTSSIVLQYFESDRGLPMTGIIKHFL